LGLWHIKHISATKTQKLLTNQQTTEMSIVKTYLVAYNTISAILWTIVWGTTVQHLIQQKSSEQLYPIVWKWLYLAQGLAILEILHSATGIVRSPLFSSIVQVSSRLFLCAGITAPVPDARYHAGFVLMTLVKMKQIYINIYKQFYFDTNFSNTLYKLSYT
jgi:hypothetical protein